MQIGVNTNRSVIFKNSQPLKDQTKEDKSKPSLKDLPEGNVVETKSDIKIGPKQKLNILA